MTSLFFNHITQKIRGAKAAADTLSSGTPHRGIAGLIREIAIKDCIRPFLTQSYLCSSGIVIDSLGNRSDQIDAIVYDRRQVPEILIGDGVGFHPVESVRYIFEIKTRLTAAGVKDAKKKFHSMRRLASFPRETSDGRIESSVLPAAVLFAFGSDIKGSEIERFLHYNPEENVPCSAVCVLGKGYWVQSPDGRWVGRATRSGTPEFLEFCQFVTGLMNTLASKEFEFRPFKPGRYVNADGTVD
ncbi:DUF6602 domain-containing protein [Methyloraptor flagellatus]|uniref:DUF6602 domain-containing protein n=1 Tax=Methyloraptor flagellatus TaxID=3162530 RepID=A0AAU7X8M9_9HYPH